MEGLRPVTPCGCPVVAPALGMLRRGMPEVPCGRVVWRDWLLASAAEDRAAGVDELLPGLAFDLVVLAVVALAGCLLVGCASAAVGGEAGASCD